MDFGAPTMNGQGQIIGGNGRFEGVSRAYEAGTAEGYRQALVKNLETFGIRPEATAGMTKPVLVRVIEADVNTQKAALASNEGAGAKMSAIEQARVDAARIADLGALVINENGLIMSGPNHNLIRAWTKEMPVTEAAEMVDKSGRLSQRGVDRLQNAVLFKAYGDSPVLDRLLESADPGARNVVSALVRSAGDAAKAKDAMASGDLYGELDITQDIVQAVEKLEQLRSAGEGLGHAAERLRVGLVGSDLVDVDHVVPELDGLGRLGIVEGCLGVVGIEHFGAVRPYHVLPRHEPVLEVDAVAFDLAAGGLVQFERGFAHVVPQIGRAHV